MDPQVLLLDNLGLRGRRDMLCSLPLNGLGPFNTMNSVAGGYAAALLSRLKDGTMGAAGFVAHRDIAIDDLLRDRYLAPLLAA